MDNFQEMISQAWMLFDDKRYDEARDVYIQCHENMSKDDLSAEVSVYMGLTYVEAFSGNYDLARDYANKLLSFATNEEDRHIYLHQLGMVERMAENYGTALSIFSDEESIINAAFPDGYDRLSANMYEQGYVNYRMGRIYEAKTLMKKAVSLAEKSEDFICKACACRGMGEILATMGDYAHAKEYFLKAIKEFRIAEDYKGAQEVETLLLTSLKEKSGDL